MSKRKFKECRYPPKTIRFCLNCEEERIFKYNPSVFHSECVVCGNRYAKKIKKVGIDPTFL